MSRAFNVARLQGETKCHICLDVLTEPDTTECGHNFCHSCIYNFCRGREVVPCPVCRHYCQKQNITSNAQLGEMVNMVQQFQNRASQSEETKTSCERHNQVLTLFCEDDLQLLCDRCIGPESHNSHRVTSIARAASHHRERLWGLSKLLKKEMKEAEELRRIQDGGTQALREQAEAQRCELNSEFERLHRCLDREQQAAFSRLKEEEKDVRQKLSQNIEAFEKRTSTLKSLLKLALAGKTSSEVDLLSTVKNFYKDYESLSNPDIFSPQLRREAYNFPLQYSALQKIIQQFTVQVTLDPDTAHQNLLVSEDKKCVTFSKKKQRVPDFLKRFTKSHVVLGFPNFSSGRHFWAVKVGEKSEWAVGICRANLSTGARQSLIPPGCWRIVWKGDCFEVSGEADPKGSQLKATRPRVIGIFLDYELGEVSFYRMPEKSHICTIGDTFAEPVCPYFYIGNNSEPLRLCSATDAE
ncbi:tripartite motif-containing protein 75-like [Peromyscus leucopus]|uniref:tripartite motif-containing protein 75-like n=1 Tax=Peromyscus leucopus TaxID=10041 RepID=UPI0010A1E087|nr:tripartite motif-containing protein 75-like [Peromyscus leucopus]